MLRKRPPGPKHIKNESWKSRVIFKVAQGETITTAAKFGGTTRDTIHAHLKLDLEFRRKFDDAMEQGTDLIEQEVITRAVEGEQMPVIYQGKPQFVWVDKKGNICEAKTKAAFRKVPHYTKRKSDILLMFLMKARRPLVFREAPPTQQVAVISGQQAQIDDTARKVFDTKAFVDELATELQQRTGALPPAGRNGNGESVHTGDANHSAGALPDQRQT